MTRSLVAAETAYRKAAERAEVMRVRRNQLVREAVEGGERPADIARALGLTRARVTQIAQQT